MIFEFLKLGPSVKQLQLQLQDIQTQLAAAHQTIAAQKIQIDHLNQEHSQAQHASTKLKDESASALKAVKDEAQVAQQASTQLRSQLEVQKKELETSNAERTKLQGELNHMVQSTKQVNDELATKKQEFTNVQTQLEEVNKKYGEQEAQLADVTQENELILNQLMAVQEELETFFLEKMKFEGLYKGVQNRWMRLEKRYPSYIDFESIELVTADSLASVPSLTWRVRDFIQNGVILDEFLFQTVLQNGNPGIGLVSDLNTPANIDSALIPALQATNSKQRERFIRMGQSEFRQLTAAAAILAQLEAYNWKTVVLPNDMDLNFWHSSLKGLPAQIQALPIILRYDAVSLKRELINPDYEHLWLDFKNLGLGLRSWPKFELRIGAAMLQRNGFSQFPKFEIPLINGKEKPFESWFAESQDDSGAKLELRFSLEKQVLDTAVLAKLTEADRALLIRLIYAIPDALSRLETQQTMINRPWNTWINFAKAAVNVVETNRQTSLKKLPSAPSKNNQATIEKILGKRVSKTTQLNGKPLKKKSVKKESVNKGVVLKKQSRAKALI